MYQTRASAWSTTAHPEVQREHAAETTELKTIADVIDSPLPCAVQEHTVMATQQQ